MSFQCPKCHCVHEVDPADRRLPPWCPKCGVDLKPDQWKPVVLPSVAAVETAPAPFAEDGVATSVTSTGPKPWLNARPAAAPEPAQARPEAEPGAAPLPAGPASAPAAEPNPAAVLVPMAAVGIALLAIAGVLAGKVRTFVENGRTTAGEVVAVWKPDPLAFAIERQHVVLQYQVNGTKYELSPEGRDVGERVEVVYPPNDPSDGRIKTTGSLYRWPMVVGALGLLPLICCVVIVCLLPERKEPAAEPAKASEGSTG